MDRISWDQAHMSLCYTISMRSPDTSTRLGSVIVAADNRLVAAGYNGWPRGVKAFEEDDPRWERPEKYAWMAHAERNALDNALRAGLSVEGCKIYVPIIPCVECARGIIQSGISEIIYHQQAQDHFVAFAKPTQGWFQLLDTTKAMLSEAGVAIRGMTDKIPLFESFLCGESFNPHVAHISTIKQPEPTPATPKLRPTGIATATVVRPGDNEA